MGKLVNIKTKKKNKHLVPKLKIDVTNYPIISVTRPPYIDEEIDERFALFSRIMQTVGTKQNLFKNIETFVEY